MAIQRKLMKGLMGQCEKPRGLLGRFFAWGMNRGHHEIMDWGLTLFSIKPGDVVLDVGCGGGGLIRKMSGLAVKGKVFGVDYSEVSVAVAKKTNTKGVAEGRVDVRRGSVAALPYPEDEFDLVTAMETHYFWPGFVACLKECRRVLKPGGRLVILAESYKGGKFDKRNEEWMSLGRLNNLGVDDFRRDFAAAGFGDIRVLEKYEKGLLCAMGSKAEAESGENGPG